MKSFKSLNVLPTEMQEWPTTRRYVELMLGSRFKGPTLRASGSAGLLQALPNHAACGLRAGSGTLPGGAGRGSLRAPAPQPASRPQGALATALNTGQA